jgi:ADP-ribose pyrophosphatase
MAMKAKKTTEQESAAQAQPAGNATKASATAKDGGKPGAGKAAGKKAAIKKAAIEKATSRKATIKKAPAAKTKAAAMKAAKAGTAQILDSEVAYEGPLFRVMRDHLIEPDGREANRDVIRHNGSVVILAIDPGKKKKDPWVVIERQYRHAAGQYLWELPAGKLDAGEAAVDGAKRELAEETGYQAKKWSPLVEYFASPGFLGESMNVFLAEGLVAGDAHPEEDEHIDFRLVKLSELLEMADKGKIIDGKTLTSVLLYARKIGLKRKS